MSDKKTRPNEDAQYIPEQRTIEVLKVLKEISDEKHPVRQQEIMDKISTTGNRKTLSDTIEEILTKINPVEYTGDNDGEYQIKYDGYDKPFDENPLVIKSTINSIRKEKRRKDADTEALEEELRSLGGGKAPTITNLRYIHDFNYEELDRLISAVALSAAIKPDEKENLIKKIVNTASKYYRTPFYDRALEKLQFNPYSAYSRIYSKSGETERRISKNVKVLQEALRLRSKVRFRFDVYGANKAYVTDEAEHIISPYYIVIYHDNYYVIGAWDKGTNACHYRIDLMSSLEVVKDKAGMPEKMRSISECKELSGRDSWDPERYMSEHIYMAYNTDKSRTRRISLKISSDKINRYTILHDWFGDTYKINKSKTADCEEGYEVVDVVTSPTMIVPWAMQYSDFVEVLDEEVREKIKNKIKEMEKKYE